MELKVPVISEGIDEATITMWLAAEGDTVTNGQDIVEFATDKATFNMPSPASGILKKIVKGEGETVKVGEVIGRIE